MDTPYNQLALSATLLATPFWADLFTYINLASQFLASITGAIIGCVTVYRMYNRWKGS